MEFKKIPDGLNLPLDEKWIPEDLDEDQQALALKALLEHLSEICDIEIRDHELEHAIVTEISVEFQQILKGIMQLTLYLDEAYNKQDPKNCARHAWGLGRLAGMLEESSSAAHRRNRQGERGLN